MIMSVWTGEVKPGQFESAIQVFTETIIPLVTKMAPGFRKGYLLKDPTSNQAVSLFVWDSEEDAANMRNNPEFVQAFQKLVQFYTEPPTRKGYEITHET